MCCQNCVRPTVVLRTIVFRKEFCLFLDVFLASSPGHSQILSHSCGEKSVEGLGSLLCHVAIITKPSPPFPVRDVVLIPGLLPIFIHGCEIKSGSGLGTRLDVFH